MEKKRGQDVDKDVVVRTAPGAAAAAAAGAAMDVDGGGKSGRASTAKHKAKVAA